MTSIDEGFQNVLLDVVVPVDDARQFFAELRQILNGLAEAIVGHIVGGGFGAEVTLVADVLFDEAVFVVTADDGIGQIQIFDHGLKLAGMMFGDLAAEDDSELIGLANRAVGIHQPLAEPIDGGTA